ncbi:Heme chaperone HemW [Dyadobacter sp. CECT 9275]|uniref:Heme chaperone HemW n=2 Tax=Dyadobacter helix TaxID=2822344 RepID=A0A916N384_9BACT|nr:Heme chaperone HemW [Dyadobacter sp. CECT 9275]
MAEAIAKEITLRKDYLTDKKLETIYFGGGTPSLLDQAELDLILNTIHTHFNVTTGAEITLEANPDDLHPDKINQLAGAGINRLSIGIQSFHEPHLKFLNRIHSSSEAERCVKFAQDTGISNISVDLIYAIPAPDHTILHQDLQRVFDLRIPHISAYCLTIEPQTAFGSWLKKKKMKPIDEEFAATQFEILVHTLGQNGFEQYEISNFASEEKYSRHNSSYWKAHPYLGVGPSAHSFNGISREYNVSHNAQYINTITQGNIPSTLEILTQADQTNEYLLTGLRTKWGVNIHQLAVLSGGTFLNEKQSIVQSFLDQGLISVRDAVIMLTPAGKLFADRIAADLFIDR